MQLRNRIALITGASSGIGLECARLFAAEGAKLVLTARRFDRLQEFARELQSEHGTESLCLALDTRNRTQVMETLGNLPAEWSDVDILVNNAGLGLGMDFIQDGDVDDWEAMIDTNLKGFLYVTKAVLPGMVRRKSGTVVTMASLAGRETYPKGNVYCATKAAVRTLAQAIRLDTNGSNIRVCNIDPGMVETEFSEIRFHGDKERAKNVYKGLTPLTGRDVADTVLFCVTRPPHVVLADIQLMPTAQASTTLAYRQEAP